MSFLEYFSFDNSLRNSSSNSSERLINAKSDIHLILILIFFIANLCLIFLHRIALFLMEKAKKAEKKANSKQSLQTAFSAILKYLKTFLLNAYFITISLHLISLSENLKDKLEIKFYDLLNKNYTLNLFYTYTLVLLNFRRSSRKVIFGTVVVQILLLLLPNLFHLLFFFDFVIYEVYNICFSVLSTLFILYITRNMYSNFQKLNFDNYNNKVLVLAGNDIVQSDNPAVSKPKKTKNLNRADLIGGTLGYFNVNDNYNNYNIDGNHFHKIIIFDLLSNDSSLIMNNKLRKAFLNLNPQNYEKSSLRNENFNRDNACIYAIEDLQQEKENKCFDPYLNKAYDQAQKNNVLYNEENSVYNELDVNFSNKLDAFLDEIKFFNYLHNNTHENNNNTNTNENYENSKNYYFTKELKTFFARLIKDKNTNNNDLNENMYPNYINNRDSAGNKNTITEENIYLDSLNDLTLNKGESLLILVNETKKLISEFNFLIKNENENENANAVNENNYIINKNPDDKYSLGFKPEKHLNNNVAAEIKLDINNTSFQNLIENKSKFFFDKSSIKEAAAILNE